MESPFCSYHAVSSYSHRYRRVVRRENILRRRQRFVKREFELQRVIPFTGRLRTSSRRIWPLGNLIWQWNCAKGHEICDLHWHGTCILEGARTQKTEERATWIDDRYVKSHWTDFQGKSLRQSQSKWISYLEFIAWNHLILRNGDISRTLLKPDAKVFREYLLTCYARRLFG